MRSNRIVPFAVSTAIFLQYLDTTVLNTAIPAIARDFHVAAIDLNLIVLAYLLAQTIVIPVSGAIADRMGAKQAFVLAVAVFTIGSALCAMSRSLEMLVAMRAVQGLGGGLMMPLGRLILVRSVDKSELIGAMNWVVLLGALGPLLGPVVGGLIVTHGSWPWIFLLNVPIALAGIALTVALVPHIPREPPARLDLPGMALVALIVVGAVLGLEMSSGGADRWSGLALLAASLLLVPLYTAHARRVAAPAIDLTLLAIPTFRRSMLSGTAIRIVSGGVAFVLPLWFQLAMHMRADMAGTLVMMLSVGTLLSRPAGALLLRRFHPRTVAVVGLGALCLILLAATQLRAGQPLPVFYGLITLLGLGIAVPILIVTPVAYLDVPGRRLAAANAFYVTVQQIALSLGITAAVWTTGAVGLATGRGSGDALPYVASLVAFAAIALLGLLDTLKIDRAATAGLSAARS